MTGPDARSLLSDGALPTPVSVPGWPRPSGFANGMTARGRLLVTAGHIGWNPLTQTIESDDFATQVAQALRNIVAVLAASGARPAHLVRLTWYITDRDVYLASLRAVGGAYREIFESHYPAMAVVIVAGLLDPRAQVEIEATAILPE